VLDYGGGDGLRYAHEVRAVAKDYTIADVSPAIVAMRSKAGDRAIRIDQLSESKLSVDVLLVLEVLEHLLDPLEALAMGVSKVAPGGQVVLSVPNPFNAWNRLRMMGGRLPASGVGGTGVRGQTWAAPHIRFFDWDSLVSLAQKAGVEATGGLIDGLSAWKFSRRFSGELRELRATKHHLLADTLVLIGTRP
jgi:hypothetical protein